VSKITEYFWVWPCEAIGRKQFLIPFYIWTYASY